MRSQFQLASTLGVRALVLGLFCFGSASAQETEATPAPVEDAAPEAASLEDATPEAESTAGPDVDALGPRFSVKLGGVGRGGATAGHVWNVPAVGPAVGGGGALTVRYRFHPRWAVDAKVSGVLGVADDGSVGGGYKAFVHLRWDWLKASWVRLQSSARAGLTGFLLIPIPTYGFEHNVRFSPIRTRFFHWYFGAGLVTDVLLIVPHLGVDVATGMQLMLGPVTLGAEIRGEGDVLVAIVANQATALAVIEATVAFAF